MLQPAADMRAVRIMMRPVNNPSLIIPFIFTIKLHEVAVLQGFDPWRQIDIVRDQHGLAGVELQNEALMAIAVAIISQCSENRSLAADLNIAPLVAVRIGDGIDSRHGLNWRRLVRIEKIQRDENDCERANRA